MLGLVFRVCAEPVSFLGRLSLQRTALAPIAFFTFVGVLSTLLTVFVGPATMFEPKAGDTDILGPRNAYWRSGTSLWIGGYSGELGEDFSVRV